MGETAVDRLYVEFRDASNALQGSGEISLGSAIDSSARKAILLAAASYFESRITGDVVEFCRQVTGSNPLVPELVLNKAVSRQYHTWFNWDGANANTFFALFGTAFKVHMTKLVTAEDRLRDSIKDFIEVGRDRNRLVHGDFATFTLEKTADELYWKYQSALIFVDRIPVELTSCSKTFVQPQVAPTPETVPGEWCF